MKTTVQPQVIAVVGGSGAGKSWFVTRLCALLGEHACHLSLDDFYRDRSHLPVTRRARLNYDIPAAIDWAGAARVLRDCRAGLPTQVPRYDFATYSRQPAAEPWRPRPIVFVDGLWLLRSPTVRQYFDLSIYLDAPASLRHARRLARDTRERGYSVNDVRHRLASMVAPMHQRYVEPQKRWADLVLSQPFGETELHHLTDHLWPLFSAAGVLPPWMHETFRADLTSLLLQHEYCN